MIRPEWIPIHGDSMWPALRSGDRARVVSFEGSPRVGDVVVIRTDRALIAHRVVAVEDGAVIARGDNCAFVDGAVALERVLGTVDEIERAGRVLERSRWDLGPRRIGRWRLRAKRTVARLLRRGA